MDYTPFFGCTSVKPNLAVTQDFYFPLSVFVERSSDPVCDGVGQASFKSRQMLFHWLKLPATLLSPTVFPFSFFILYIGRYCGAGIVALIGCKSLSPRFLLPTSFNNNNDNNI